MNFLDNLISKDDNLAFSSIYITPFSQGVYTHIFLFF